jgi:hypothetical protein
VHDAHMRHDTTSITTLLTLPPDLVERDRVRRQALRAGAIEHPGLAPLRSADFAGDGLALTWAVPVDSHPMGSNDDAIAVLAPIAAGLAVLHDAGVAHGGVTADAVHVSGGRGLITGWRPGGSPADDVAALIGLLDAALPSGSVGADVVHLLVAGVDPDPDVRPSMARVASVLDSASRCASPPVSPPAQRRARFDDALPPRTAPPVAATVPPSRSVGAPRHDRLTRPSGSGRHAAPRAPAGWPGRSAKPPLSGSFASFVALPRIPWRWGVALGGAAAVALLGMSALGSSGSAQEICPAPMPAQAPAQAGVIR